MTKVSQDARAPGRHDGNFHLAGVGTASTVEKDLQG
jgi:hypothetical protein